MTKHCLNCAHPVKEKFCPQCGQATDVTRITFKSFGEEFIHTFTHAEKSIAGTTWQLLKTPGKVIDEYITGKRKKYQAPVGFFLVWVTISILTHRLVLASIGFHPVYLEGLTFSNADSIHAFITHGEWFYILTIPVSAAIFYFILAKGFYSYIEAFVAIMYCFGMSSMFWVFCYLIGGFAFSLNVLHWKFYLFQILMSIGFTLWVCISLFHCKPVKFLWLRIFLFMVINSFVVLKFLELLSNFWVQLDSHFHF